MHQQIIKIWFDKHVDGDKQFEVGDQIRNPEVWLGHYEIDEKIGDATYCLQSL